MKELLFVSRMKVKFQGPNDAIEKIGLLAQEVQKAFPELVKQAGDAEGTLSVNYQGMIPVLINAIKEQQKQIDELKALIK